MKTKNLLLIYSFVFVLLSLTLLISGCSKNEPDKKVTDKSSTGKKQESGSNELTAKGKELFYASAENGMNCADCHSDGSNTSQTPLNKYFSSLKGVLKRPATYHGMFKGDDIRNNAGGAVVCWKQYLKHEDNELTPDQINALNAYFESVEEGGDTKEQVYETIALPKRDREKLKAEQEAVMKLQGDIERGKSTFKEACGHCHGNENVKDVPGLVEYEGNEKGIVFNVRLGHDAMPFYHKGKLDDQTLADISAFVMSIVKK